MNCIEDIYGIAYQEENLMSVMIELTSLCNWKCEHCYVTDSNHDKYNLDNLRQLFTKFRDKGIIEIIFIGGEIFLRKDIIEIISLARSMFFDVVLETNISLLDEEKIKKLSELYIDEISCSIFSLDEKVHDNITGVKGSLNKVLENLELLKKYNIKTVIKTPIMQKNKYDFRKLRTYCLEKGFIYKVNTSIFAKRNGETLEHLNLINDDLKDIIDEIDAINKFFIGERPLNNYVCTKLRVSLFLDTQGEIYPCVNYRQALGNIFFNDLDDVWNNTERKKISKLKFKDMKDCSKCNNLNKCAPCPGISHMESGSSINCTKASLNLSICRG